MTKTKQKENKWIMFLYSVHDPVHTFLPEAKRKTEMTKYIHINETLEIKENYKVWEKLASMTTPSYLNIQVECILNVFRVL